jgi:hypothetical protein
LVHKKGSKADPEKYRPIALLQIVETVLSLIVYGRMVKTAPQEINMRQVGFLPGKSGRSAVHLLLRTVEKAVEGNRKKVLIFVDFQKAFDSLRHQVMLAALARRGCPEKILEVLQHIYGPAAARLKYGKGDFSDEFKHARGIRQGSALSPLLFVTVLDWAIQRASDAMQKKGFAGRWHWLAYADDIVLEAENTETAELALKELEAACLFVGLRISEDKTETIPINLGPKRVPSAKAMIDEVLVKREWESADSLGTRGEIVDYNGAEKVLKQWELDALAQNHEVRSRATHFVRLRSAATEHMTPWRGVEMRQKGHAVLLKTNEPDSPIRISRLAMRRFIDKTLNKHVCRNCNLLLPDAEALRAHQRTGHCWGYDVRRVPVAQQITRRISQRIEAQKRQLIDQWEEEVDLRTINGKRLKCTGKFKYLGTMVSPSQGMATELQRRAMLARSGLHQMNKVWRSRILGQRAKKQFFQALILSTLLYNCETWIMGPNQWNFLNKTYHKIARIAMGERKKKVENGKYETPSSFLARYNLDEVKTMIVQRKAVWLGHAKRANDKISLAAFQDAKNSKSGWWTNLVGELGSFGTTPEEIISMAQQPTKIKLIFKNKNSIGRTAGQSATSV